MTIGGEIAQAMSRATIETPLRLRTDAGPCLNFTVTRSWPIGRNALVEFVGLAEPIPSTRKTGT